MLELLMSNNKNESFGNTIIDSSNHLNNQSNNNYDTYSSSSAFVEDRMINNANNLHKINLNSSNRYHDFYIGLTLALLSSLFIGSSFILKKKGLLKLSANNFSSLSNQFKQSPKSPLRAAQGGYGYLKEGLWWSGFLTMAVGELCNFAAYGFVPATLVTPLGALSVLVSAVMAAYFLNEKLNSIGKIGCVLTAIGSTVMVIHAPKDGEIKTVKELLSKILDPEFISFTILSAISLLVLIFVLAPKHGNSNILVYILICSILGSFTVMSCKGLSLGIKEIVSQRPSVSYFYTCFFGVSAASCIIIQINYLNRSLDIFNTAIVTTVYYVLFTLFVMIASALLFKELLSVSVKDFVGCMCGFSTIVCALCLIHFFKTGNIESKEMKSLNSLLEENERNNQMILNNILANSSNNNNNNNNDIDKIENENNFDERYSEFNSKNESSFYDSQIKEKHDYGNVSLNHLPTNYSQKAKIFSNNDSKMIELNLNSQTELNKREDNNNNQININNKNEFSFLRVLKGNYKLFEEKYLNKLNLINNSNSSYSKLQQQADEIYTDSDVESNKFINNDQNLNSIKTNVNFHKIDPIQKSKNLKRNEYLSSLNDMNGYEQQDAYLISQKNENIRKNNDLTFLNQQQQQETAKKLNSKLATNNSMNPRNFNFIVKNRNSNKPNKSHHNNNINNLSLDENLYRIQSDDNENDDDDDNYNDQFLNINQSSSLINLKS